MLKQKYQELSHSSSSSSNSESESNMPKSFESSKSLESSESELLESFESKSSEEFELKSFKSFEAESQNDLSASESESYSEDFLSMIFSFFCPLFTISTESDYNFAQLYFEQQENYDHFDSQHSDSEENSIDTGMISFYLFAFINYF